MHENIAESFFIVSLVNMWSVASFLWTGSAIYLQ